MLSHRAAIQRELDRAEPTEDTLNYSRNAKSSTCEGRTPCKNRVWKLIGWEVAVQNRIWGPVGSKWDMRQQCALLAKTTK